MKFLKILAFTLLGATGNASAMAYVKVQSNRSLYPVEFAVPREGTSVGEFKAKIIAAYNDKLDPESIKRVVFKGTPIELDNDSQFLSPELIEGFEYTGLLHLIVDKDAATKLLTKRDILKDKALIRQAQLDMLWSPTDKERSDFWILTGPAGSYSGTEAGLKMIEDKILEHGGTLEPLDSI